MTAAKDRRWKLDRNKQEAHYKNREVHQDRDRGGLYDNSVAKVCGDGTVLIDATDRYRVILHTNKRDEHGKEIIEIVDELADIDSALRRAAFYNESSNLYAECWAEVLNYDMVYARLNGEMVDGIRKRHLRPRKAKLRVAKVG